MPHREGLPKSKESTGHKNKRRAALGAAAVALFGAAVGNHYFNREPANSEATQAPNNSDNNANATVRSRTDAKGNRPMVDARATTADSIEATPTPDAAERERNENKLTQAENDEIEKRGYIIKEDSYTGNNGTRAYIETDVEKYNLAIEKELNDDGSQSYILRELRPPATVGADDTVSSFATLDETLNFAGKIVKMSDQYYGLSYEAAPTIGDRNPAKVQEFHAFINNVYYPYLESLGLPHHSKDMLYIK